MQRFNWKFQILLLILLEEIWRSPVEVDRLYHSLQGFMHPRWAGVLPSTVSLRFWAEPSSTEQYSHQKSDSAVACSGIFHQFATSRVLLTSWTGWSTELRFDSGKKSMTPCASWLRESSNLFFPSFFRSHLRVSSMFQHALPIDEQWPAMDLEIWNPRAQRVHQISASPETNIKNIPSLKLTERT